MYTQTAFTHRPFYTQILLHTDPFTHRRFYTQTLLHTDHFYTQTLLHTDPFTHRPFYTQTLLRDKQSWKEHTQPLFHTDLLLHTDPFNTQTEGLLHTGTRLFTQWFTAQAFYTQTLLHKDTLYTQTMTCVLHTDTGPFTHRPFYTKTLLHTDLLHTEPFTHRQMLLHTNTFTHRPVCTQTLLHTDTFTHRPFYTQTLLHTDPFTHRPFYTQTLLHTEPFTHIASKQFFLFYTQTLSQTMLLHRRTFSHRFTQTDNSQIRNFTPVFDDRNLISCERVDRTSFCATTHKSAIFPQFLTIEPHFVRKGCADTQKITNFTSRSNLISCEKVARKSAIFPQFLTIEPHFVRKGCDRYTSTIGNFSSVFDDRTSFRAKVLHFVIPRWHCPRPKERRKKEDVGEGKRKRHGQM